MVVADQLNGWREFDAGPRLKEQLQRQLHDSRRIRCADYAKSGELPILIKGQGIIHIPVWLAKLSVIESVKQFHSEFGVHSFGYRRIFQKRDVPIIETRPGEEPSPGVTENA